MSAARIGPCNLVNVTMHMAYQHPLPSSTSCRLRPEIERAISGNPNENLSASRFRAFTPAIEAYFQLKFMSPCSDWAYIPLWE
jgi:hypothetical protein